MQDILLKRTENVRENIEKIVYMRMMQFRKLNKQNIENESYRP